MRQLGKATLFVLGTVAVICTGVREAIVARTADPEVTLMRTPGIQPQAVMDRGGVLHVVYFDGDPAAGDLYYVRKAAGDAAFSRPIRVNSVAGSAVAIGSVRGAQVAVGRGGRLHVMWLGSKKALPRAPGGATPVLYTRFDDRGTAFEPERNVVQFAVGLDGGGAVAADQQGNVYVVWHSDPTSAGETRARVWVAHSKDDGRTFSREVAASDAATGACGCCGLAATADRDGRLEVLYRAAGNGVHRDMRLLVSNDHGNSFQSRSVGPWEYNACPMTTAQFDAGGSKLLAAWETAGQVFYAEVSGGNPHLPPVAPPGTSGDRKHPVVAVNASGDTLLAWTDGTAWQRGGSVGWQVFDAAGRPTGIKGSAPGVPVWGLVAAIPHPGGGFTILY